MKPRSVNISDEAMLDSMLEAYYAGETTAGQEALIAECLRRLKPIPEKYRADAALFEALTDIRIDRDSVEIPADLAQRIARATYARTKMPRHLRFVRWTSAAAAIALLATVAVGLLRDKPDEQPVIRYAASELRKDTVSPIREIRVAGLVSDTVKKVVVSRQKAPVSQAREVVEVDPYTEVSDSTTVVEIMGNVFGKLDKTLALADRSIKKTDLALNNINETVNKILDK